MAGPAAFLHAGHMKGALLLPHAWRGLSDAECGTSGCKFLVRLDAKRASMIRDQTQQ